MQTSRRITADLTTGELTETLKALQAEGMTADEFAAIHSRQGMRNEIMEAVLKRRFNSPQDMIASLLEINEHVWKDQSITEEAIRALDEPPEPPQNNRGRLHCLCLLHETGDAVETFKRNWRAMSWVYGHKQIKPVRLDSLLMFSPRVLCQRPVISYERQPGLRWAVVELGRAIPYRYEVEVERICVSDKCMGLGQELPLIAALHPGWALSINGVSVPFICAPDIRVAVGQVTYMPCLRPQNEWIELSAVPFGGGDSIYGSGSFRYVS